MINERRQLTTTNNMIESIEEPSWSIECRQLTTTNIMIESKEGPSWSKLYEKRVESFKSTLSRVI